MQSLPGTLDATYGGGEANVCASLAMLGTPSRYLTALPPNPVAQAFAAELRGLGVDVGRITWNPKGRMGVYYAEHGAAQRGSNVVYDREGSTISLLGPEDYDFAAMLDGVGHLHITGITPSLSENAFASTLALVEAASERGIVISCDLNFRKKLWTSAQANAVMSKLMPYVDVCIANEEDAKDVFGIAASGTDIAAGKLSREGYRSVAEQLCAHFGFKAVAITLRGSISASDNDWAAMLYTGGEAYFSPTYHIRIVDRVGGGDSFGAGLIYAMLNGKSPQDTVNFAVAASCLKHSIEHDFDLVSVSEVEALAAGNASGRVQR